MEKLPIELDSEVSYEESFELFKNCSVKAQSFDVLPPMIADDKDFYDDFLGSLIQKPYYKFCRFHKSPFLACNGSYSVFENCDFFDCKFKDSDFRYSSFDKCKFIQDNHFQIDSSGFNYSSFRDNIFENLEICGCSFRHMEIKGTKISNCTMKNSSFEHCNITDCVFENMDLRYIGIRYNNFHNITFKNIIFPILDMTCNFDLLKEFQSQPNNIKFSLGNNAVVSYWEALSLLKKLIPYYKETKQFFHLINIMWINNDQKNFAYLLPQILEYTIKKNDYETLQNVCALIVKTEMLNGHRLHDLYNSIKDKIIPEELPFHLYKSYSLYMDNIKNILLINPKNEPRLQISLETNISCLETKKLLPILNTIEETVREVSVTLYPTIEISHHSPYDILILICGNIDYLQQLAQTFYYTIGGVNCLYKIYNSIHGKVSKGNDINFDKEQTTIDINIKNKVDIRIRKYIKKHTKRMEYYIHIN